MADNHELCELIHCTLNEHDVDANDRATIFLMGLADVLASIQCRD